MRVHFIIHEYFEAPGAYENWAQQHGHAITFSRVYLGESLPEQVNTIDFLIIMGGPQSPATTQDACAHFDSKAEQAVILAAAQAGKVVIGVCLGAQLIGEAMGGHFSRSPEKEIGKFPITLTPAGRSAALFSHFGNMLEVGHWHNDMPGLTPQATIIATSEGCPRQIIAWSPLVYGFQCHMELTGEVVEQLIENSADALRNVDNHRFVESPERLRTHDWRKMNERLFIFLDKLAQDYCHHVSAASGAKA